MSSVIAAIGIWLMFVLVFTTLVGAQQAAAPAAKPPAISRMEVGGKIKSVDPAGKTVLLEETVEEKGGQKVLTAIQVN